MHVVSPSGSSNGPRRKSEPERACFYFWNGRAVYLGSLSDNAEHRHHAVQVTIGLSGSFRLRYSGLSGEYRGAIIASDQAHSLDGRGDAQAVMLMDPESTTARRLTETLCRDQGIAEFDPLRLNSLIADLGALIVEPKSCLHVRRLCDRILGRLTDRAETAQSIDPRIEKAVQVMRRSAEKKESVKEIAEIVCLSESRLIHLFSEQIGIPLRRYRLWLRLLTAVEQILAGVSFTTAAHASGFADSAHLSRTFKRMFGMTLSNLFKNSGFVQVISCLDE